jgi:XTP/dITP diphosphohydrolase
MTQKLLVATGNTHKTQEIAAMLGGAWQVLDLKSFPELASPEETGLTFEANARIKALAASEALPELWVLSDDSGLEVDALGGEPGVISARYAGPAATDADNRQRLLRELPAVPQDVVGGWRARFRCCMVLAKGGRDAAVFHGSVEGKVVTTEAGDGGFGYDPLFIPDGHSETFGTLTSSVKNALSHRARALSQVTAWLGSQQTLSR